PPDTPLTPSTPFPYTTLFRSSPAAPASGLVGQPAPEVKLNLVSGKPFLLSKEKGHIVVLDFWASWCGPCMQAMPMVDEVVCEFEDRKSTRLNSSHVKISYAVF